MQRYPDGVGKNGFYQQEAPDYFPDWIERKTVKKEEGEVTHVICRNTATLVYLANQGCITPHTWLSRVDRLHFPDLMVFDLDPPGDDFKPVVAAARLHKNLLTELGLIPFVKTSGSRGLHLVIPLDRGADFPKVRDFAGDVARVLAERHPQTLTTEVRKNKRRGRLFLDTARNSYAQTVAPPYAVRAKSKAPIATPLDWEELSLPDLTSQSYHIGNIFRRLGQKDDPWRDIARRSRSLDGPRDRLNSIMAAELK